MINLLSKTDDFIKNDKFANKTWKGVISEKVKAKTCFADKDLSSWTGLGRSGHVQIMTFGAIFGTFRVQNKVLDEISK